MRFPDSSHWPRKCQISHMTWKSLYTTWCCCRCFFCSNIHPPAPHRRTEGRSTRSRRLRQHHGKVTVVGAEQLRGLALSLSSQSDLIPHAKRPSPGSSCSLPTTCKTMAEALLEIKEQRKPAKKQGHGRFWIIQHGPKAGQKYYSRKMPEMSWSIICKGWGMKGERGRDW